jgi:hypothetical protein
MADTLVIFISVSRPSQPTSVETDSKIETRDKFARATRIGGIVQLCPVWSYPWFRVRLLLHVRHEFLEACIDVEYVNRNEAGLMDARKTTGVHSPELRQSVYG